MESKLIETLMALAKEDSPDLAFATEKVAEAFLSDGSETIDNLRAVERIEYGIYQIGDDIDMRGIKLKGTNIGVSDIVGIVEEEPVPARVREIYPDINQEQWEAAIRTVIMVMTSLDRRLK